MNNNLEQSKRDCEDLIWKEQIKYYYLLSILIIIIIITY